jgi:hypothetical protein
LLLILKRDYNLSIAALPQFTDAGLYREHGKRVAAGIPLAAARAGGIKYVTLGAGILRAMEHNILSEFNSLQDDLMPLYTTGSNH